MLVRFLLSSNAPLLKVIARSMNSFFTTQYYNRVGSLNA